MNPLQDNILSKSQVQKKKNQRGRETMKPQTLRQQCRQALHTSQPIFAKKPFTPKYHQTTSTTRTWYLREQISSPASDAFQNKHQTPAPAKAPCQKYCSSPSSPNPETKPAANTTASPKSEVEAEDAISCLLSTPTWSLRTLLPPRRPSTSTSSSNASPTSNEITTQTLRHILRLSSLPYPSSRPSDPPTTATTTTTSSSSSPEASALQTLRAQLHFLRAIQSILPLTQQTKPLVSIRDETSAGISENCTVTLADLRGVLNTEVVVGRVNRRRRRVRVSGAASTTSTARNAATPGRRGGTGGGVMTDTGTGQGKGENVAVEADNWTWNPLDTASKTAGGGRYFLVDSGGMKGAE